ncbi:MAG: GAF domain-containing protein [Jaaginema sp. PMC 1079.18]|nr:GAF domain-containing protein [Jaaginema sp. PMC 1080.18]MEC4851850.1 GAF domain-containing protein [Jaaginema sp. PMC 1079.18]MEC4868561.1 GAF domain-containing protein [Jaaginema sp. PMC 1078.18]
MTVSNSTPSPTAASVAPSNLAAVRALRSHLEQAGLLERADIQQYWRQIEQLSQNSANFARNTPNTASNHQERQRLSQISAALRSTASRNALLQTTVTELQRALQCDRVTLCRLTNPDRVLVVAEAMIPGYTPTLKQSFPVTCFQPETYKNGTSQPLIAIDDIYTAQFSPYGLQLLEKYQVKSQCAIPILLENQPWGWLVAQTTERQRLWQESDLTLLLHLATELNAQLQPYKFRYQLQQKNRSEDVYNKIVEDVRSETTDIDKLFANTCTEVRQVLQCDRALIYRFKPDWTGEVIAESVGRGWVSLLIEQDKEESLRSDRTDDDRCILKKFAKGSNEAKDTYLKDTQGGPYALGKPYTSINDIYNEGFSPCYIDTLEKYQVRAYAMVPIYHNEQLWGLLGAYQNSGPRYWSESEVQLLTRLSAPLGVALQKSSAQAQIDSTNARLSQTAQRDAALVQTVERLWQTLDIDTIFTTATDELRSLIEVDRVTLYRFEGKEAGQLVSEAVGRDRSPWSAENSSSFQRDLHNLYDRDRQDFKTRNATLRRITNIEKAGFAIPVQEKLTSHNIHAYLSVPITQNGKIWGIMTAYDHEKERDWQQAEVNIIAQLGKQLEVAIQQTRYVTQLEQKTTELAEAAERDRAIATTLDRIRNSSNLDNIFRTTTQELRRLLKSDRAIVYQFNEDWSGQVIAESVGSGWVSLLSEQKEDEILQGDRIQTDRCIIRQWSHSKIDTDTYLQKTGGGRYSRGQKYTCVDDIYQANFPACYIESLEKYQVKAYIIVPIFQGEKLWGLLGVYQNSGPRQWQERDVNLMLRVGTPLGIALQQSTTLNRLDRQAKQEKVIGKLLEKIQQAPGTDFIFRTTCTEVRQALEADRAIVYRFREDWSGEVIAESVGSGWTSLLIEQKQDEVLGGDRIQTDRCILRKWASGTRIDLDTYLQENAGGKYAQGEKVTQVDDIYAKDFPPCYINSLEKYQVRAYIIVPIFQSGKLWGLLGVYQNSGPRRWQEPEVSLMTRLSAPLGVALQQAEVREQLSEQSEQMALLAQREKMAKEQLQQRAVQLLMAIKPSFEGDLTARAPITEDEVGTIADAYNNTLQSLRRIVVQVKAAADKVAQTSSMREVSISQLAHQAQEELQAIEATLIQIQDMAHSTEAVVSNAQQVELAVARANQTVSLGDNAMNRTVDGFSEIRKTVAETSQKIKRLGESSQKITKVVNLIGNFATQTNLLALNAAIEATRAGEYGRGFAVVADEVRSLARQSEDATNEIEQIVLEIQQETSEVAAAMDTGIQQVVSGTNLVNETRQNLNEIVEATAQISELVAGITQASQTQQGRSRDVTQTMQNVAAIARSTSEDAISISASFQTLMATAEELQASVGQFKVD